MASRGPISLGTCEGKVASWWPSQAVAELPWGPVFSLAQDPMIPWKRINFGCPMFKWINYSVIVGEAGNQKEKLIKLLKVEPPIWGCGDEWCHGPSQKGELLPAKRQQLAFSISKSIWTPFTTFPQSQPTTQPAQTPMTIQVSYKLLIFGLE